MSQKMQIQQLGWGGHYLLVFCREHGFIARIKNRPIPYDYTCPYCGVSEKVCLVKTQRYAMQRMASADIIVTYARSPAAETLLTLWHQKQVQKGGENDEK